MRSARPLLVAAALLLASPLGSQQQGEVDRLVDLLRIRPGATVADIGAGNGRWAVALAEHVGPQGRVFATEIETDLVEQIEDRARDAGLENLVVVLGRELGNGLPSACCDAILLRMVYHHFTAPAAQRTELRRALKPGGLVAMIDTVPQRGWRRLADVPDRGGHGIGVADLIEEMTADGFVLVERRDGWMENDERYAVVFRDAASSP